MLSCILLTTAKLGNGQTNEKQSEQQPEQSSKHEYSVYVTGGMSNILYSLQGGGTTSGGFGVGGGVGYTFNFNRKWGISTGLEISTYATKASFETLRDSYRIYDANSNPPGNLVYSDTIDKYEEKQRLALFSIPIKLRFQTPVSGSASFYAAGGFKLGFPVSSKATISGASVKASGYYDFEHVTYVNMAQYGFFNGQRIEKAESKPKLGLAAVLSLESGFKFNLGVTSLYAGIYFDYALNDLKKSGDKHPITFDYPVSYESLLNSSFADKVNLMSVGVKVGIGF